ncbi:MAG: hypothetical protein JSR71_06085 [Proteobacteria bacterium]|nr:hypothetical protein [Pseudomonadota bacterium]
MNAKVAVWLLKQRLSIFSELDNVFDAENSDLLGSQLPGRWWMGGLKFIL